MFKCKSPNARKYFDCDEGMMQTHKLYDCTSWEGLVLGTKLMQMQELILF